MDSILVSSWTIFESFSSTAVLCFFLSFSSVLAREEISFIKFSSDCACLSRISWMYMRRSRSSLSLAIWSCSWRRSISFCAKTKSHLVSTARRSCSAIASAWVFICCISAFSDWTSSFCCWYWMRWSTHRRRRFEDSMISSSLSSSSSLLRASPRSMLFSPDDWTVIMSSSTVCTSSSSSSSSLNGLVLATFAFLAAASCSAKYVDSGGGRMVEDASLSETTPSRSASSSRLFWSLKGFMLRSSSETVVRLRLLKGFLLRSSSSTSSTTAIWL
mmetsp:Transcript_24662/g.54310  ORF Transcript_24662/g.54310 Transcript_24662/m.54310 type:complete len:273 (-) Transcript_24662:385-1203(-)